MQARARLSAMAAIAAMAALFAFTAAFRFLNLENGFPNDHFMHLAGARQMLAGEWPTRDFQDPGLPMMYVVSAAANVLFGPTLFAEALLVSFAFAAAAVLTMLAVAELTGSWTLGALAALLEVAVFPRTYGYPKVLLYAAGFLLMQRYVTRPTQGRMAALAACAAIAFLFRHDHGLYLTAGGLVAVLLAPAPNGWSGSASHAAVFAAFVAALVAPYLLYVQLNGGLLMYVRTGVEFSAREAGRQWLVWPSLSGPYHPLQTVLVYLYHALPFAALAVTAAQWRSADVRVTLARVAPLVIVALLVNFSFIRDPLDTRLPDAIVPAVVLLAWLTHRMWSARSLRWVAVSVSMALVVLFGRAVLIAGNTYEELDRSSLLSWSDLPEHAASVTADLKSPLAASQMPSEAAFHLQPFLRYASRCTAPDHRLLVIGFLTEVPVLARRPFAGGQSSFIPGYFASDENQRLVLKRLRSQVVPFVLIPLDAPRAVEAFSYLAAYLQQRYVPLATAGDPSDGGVQILVDSELRPRSWDAETGWPCFV